ncbi:MAG TPA: hypothetical protein VFJ16_18765 [Longimicrobium sp.]|nr:hypothetical protein [Longimicrobium sp.]
MIAAGAVVIAPPHPAAAGPVGDPLPVVRAAVRSILERTPAFAELDPDERRAMARAMVTVCHAAATLIREEVLSEGEIASAAPSPPPPSPRPPSPAPAGPSAGDGNGGRAGGLRDELPRPATAAALSADGAGGEPLAMAQNAQQEYGGTAVDRVAGTARNIMNAVSFPRFVTELINGVFKAIVDSNQTQLHQYVELLNNVAASLDGFADGNMGSNRAREWLVERYPAAFEFEEAEDPADRDPGEPPPERRLRRKGNGPMPSEAQLRTDLGMAADEPVTVGDPESLLPLVRRRLARMRQEMLATMVQMGMQRIVIDSGRITAAMRLHIDATSAAQQDRGSRFDMTNTVNAEAHGGMGVWGASASIQNTIGYVSTESTRTTESLHADVELTSSVELNFRSDYVPLNRLAGPGQAQAIQANSRNPEFEAARAAEAQRSAAEATSDAARATAVGAALAPRPAPPPPPPAAPRPATPTGTSTGGTGTGGTATGTTATGTGGTGTGGTGTGTTGTGTGSAGTGGTGTGGTGTGGTGTGTTGTGTGGTGTAGTGGTSSTGTGGTGSAGTGGTSPTGTGTGTGGSTGTGTGGTGAAGTAAAPARH